MLKQQIFVENKMPKLTKKSHLRNYQRFTMSICMKPLHETNTLVSKTGIDKEFIPKALTKWVIAPPKIRMT